MRKTSTRMLAEAGLLLALAQILSYVKVYEAPFGGSVTAGSMIPIILFALRWGAGWGVVVGAVYGVMQFFLGGEIYSYHIVSILFDYLVAFGMLGLAGLFKGTMKGVFAGTFIGIFGRFICHIISGVIVWASYAPEGMNPWIYSVLYNGSYLLPEFILSMLILWFLYKPLIKNINQI